MVMMWSWNLDFACVQLHEDPFGSLWPKCLHQRVYVFVWALLMFVSKSQNSSLYTLAEHGICALMHWNFSKQKHNLSASVAIRIYFRCQPTFHLHTRFLIPAFVILNICCSRWLFIKHWMVTESLMTLTHLLDEGASEKCWLNFSCDSDWDQ